MSASDNGIVAGALRLIGRTPLVRLARVAQPGGAELCGKLEAVNPGGSVKDRPALAMIEAAERAGSLGPGSTIVEATSGNTGISLSMIAAVKGYKCVVVMPEDMSEARRQILKAYGAEVVLTPAHDGMWGAVQRAERLVAETEGAWTTEQFANPANPESHARATAREILDDTRGELDAFVAGVGTGGTLCGVARVLKEALGSVTIVAVEPRASAVLSGGEPGLHGIPGIGAGFLPEVLDQSLVDRVVTVTDLAAERMVRRLAREEGLLLGPSSGANVHAAAEIAGALPKGARVVTVLPDGGDRYIS